MCMYQDPNLNILTIYKQINNAKEAQGVLLVGGCRKETTGSQCPLCSVLLYEEKMLWNQIEVVVKCHNVNKLYT